jgi:hypothetical protein
MKIINFTNWRTKFMEQKQKINNDRLSNYNPDLNQDLPPRIIYDNYQQRRLDMCDRLFESVVIDLKIAIENFEKKVIVQDALVCELDRICRYLKMFSSHGEVRTLIAKTTTIILDDVARELCNEINSPDNIDDDETTCHC